MQDRFAELKEMGVDISRFTPLEKVHCIHTSQKGISCRFPQCNFRCYFRQERDEETGEMVYVFKLTIFKNAHNGPLH